MLEEIIEKVSKIILDAYAEIHKMEPVDAIKMVKETMQYAPSLVKAAYDKAHMLDDANPIPELSRVYCSYLNEHLKVGNFEYFKEEDAISSEKDFIRFANVRPYSEKENSAVERYIMYFHAADILYVFNVICKLADDQCKLTGMSDDEKKFRLIDEYFIFNYGKPISSTKYDVSKTARRVGYTDNKDVKFEYIRGITIKKFRSLKNRNLNLGKYLTVITGKNGTMKSSLLGLLAHPFSSPTNAKDLYGHPLKTDMKDVFKLSLTKDSGEYIYYLNAVTLKGEEISEPIRLYARPGENRHRVTVGAGNTRGEGNFLLNTSMINLSRLYPMIETNSGIVNIQLTQDEKKRISKDYFDIMQREAFADFESVSDGKIKNTCGPKGTYYDFDSISSGEDNLGSILYKLIAFERACRKGKQLQGLICIDEIEASLHPVTQVRIFDFLLRWSKKYHIQIVMTTHSLYLVKHCLEKQQELQKNGDEDGISLTDISTMQVGDDRNYKFLHNPDYKTIYKELTYNDMNDGVPLYKVNLLCEDKEAAKVIRKVLQPYVMKHVNIIAGLGISEQSGTPWNVLYNLASLGQKLLDDAVIVVDADIPDDKVAKVKFSRFTKLYDPDGLCLEKGIVKFISQLPGDDPIFSQDEKSAVNSWISDAGVDTKMIDKQKVAPYKKWAKEHSKLYNKALDEYIKKNKEGFSRCRHTIVKMINECLEVHGITPIEIRK